MTCRGVGAWACVLLCLTLATLPSPAQPVPAPSRAFVDEAVNAHDVLIRIGELRELGNLTEGARIAQRLLDEDGERLLAHPQDKELFEPVRARVHALLMGWPDLLEKYRVEHEPRAGELVSQDRNEDVVRTLFLTPSGFEAALRFAQSQLEAARFESARMILEELATHPDCVQLKAADGARLAGELHAYLTREDVRDLVERLARRGDVDARALLRPSAPPPPASLSTSRTCQDPSTQPHWEELSKEPLQSVTFLHTPESVERGVAIQQLSSDIVAWMSPCLSGDVAYVCDELGFSALDSATLAAIWRVVPGEVSRFSAPARPDFGFLGANARFPEDLASPAVARGVVVGVTGLPVSGTRLGDGRVHAVRASDGQLLWSVEVQYLDPRLEGGTVRGAPVIEGDTVVLGVRKGGQGRRVTALYLLGLDLFTGEMRYARLIGSGGTVMWQRSQTRPDSTLLDRGVAYRADDMGAIGAIDATTGRVLWVRTLPGRTPTDGVNMFNVGEQRAAFESHRPVLASSSLYVIAPDSGEVVELDQASGFLRSRRAGADLGEPAYLVALGKSLACVSRTGVAFVAASRLSDGPVTRITSTGGASTFRTVGRAVNMDGTLCIPVESGLVLVPPDSPAKVRLHPFDRSGNVVTPDAPGTRGGSSGHVLIADHQGLHTFLSWERAKQTLEDRVARAPRDPVPLLSYLQLALRQGKSTLAPGLADRIIALVESDRESAAMEKARGELFALLHRSMLSSQRDLDGGKAQPGTGTFELPPVRDGTLLTALGERLMRVADAPTQRALALFDLAFVRSYQQQPHGAVEALQEILSDDALADVTAQELNLPGVQGDTTAGHEATARLAALLTNSGPAPYAPFEDEALHASRLLAVGARGEEAAALARRYPASSSAPGLWARASEGAIREGSPALAREYLARGVDSVLLLRRIGRDAGAEDVSRLATGLVRHATSRSDIEPALLLLLALEREFPGCTVATTSGTQPLSVAVQLLRSRIAEREGRFSIGDAPSGKVTALEGWQPLSPLSTGRAGDATSLSPMVSRGNDRIAMFAPSLSDGRMVMLWQRAIEVLPQVVQLTPERTLLYHPRTSAPTLEAVSHEGITLWKSSSLRDLLDTHCGAALGGPSGTRINTPLDGMTRRDDVIFALDGSMLIVAERAGRVMAIDTGTGKVRWGVTPGLTRTFDVDARVGRVLLVGATEPADESSSPRPRAMALDLASGATLWNAQTESLDEHARWGLILDDADCVLGTSHRIVRLNGRTGGVAWSNARRELRTSGGGGSSVHRSLSSTTTSSSAGSRSRPARGRARRWATTDGSSFPSRYTRRRQSSRSRRRAALRCSTRAGHWWGSTRCSRRATSCPRCSVMGGW